MKKIKKSMKTLEVCVKGKKLGEMNESPPYIIYYREKENSMNILRVIYTDSLQETIRELKKIKEMYGEIKYVCSLKNLFE